MDWTDATRRDTEYTTTTQRARPPTSPDSAHGACCRRSGRVGGSATANSAAGNGMSTSLLAAAPEREVPRHSIHAGARGQRAACGKGRRVTTSTPRESFADAAGRLPAVRLHRGARRVQLDTAQNARRWWEFLSPLSRTRRAGLPELQPTRAGSLPIAPLQKACVGACQTLTGPSTNGCVRIEFAGNLRARARLALPVRRHQGPARKSPFDGADYLARNT